ncbi:MAG: tRNA (N6-isopentenyl adenosine(37)-C2)-methylthiotransferase MiaB, partial [Calditrichaeota bacterium]|nr:tRNA (N6-isopentenyl adenosine(37)-C2)-methylthiotransferase MiaB [Calditrichota bacterium]
MNVSDTEIVKSILSDADYEMTPEIEDADVVMLNTCSIRENAETRVFGRLGAIKRYKQVNPDLKVGILGCMATHQRENIFEKESLVDLVVGPDQYRKLPELLAKENRTPEFELDLSKFETYSDIYPARTEGVTGWVTITRG